MTTEVAALGEPMPKREQVVPIAGHIEDVAQVDEMCFAIELCVDVDISMSFCVSL